MAHFLFLGNLIPKDTMPETRLGDVWLRFLLQSIIRSPVGGLEGVLLAVGVACAASEPGTMRTGLMPSPIPLASAVTTTASVFFGYHSVSKTA